MNLLFPHRSLSVIANFLLGQHHYLCIFHVVEQLQILINIIDSIFAMVQIVFQIFDMVNDVNKNYVGHPVCV